MPVLRAARIINLIFNLPLQTTIKDPFSIQCFRCSDGDGEGGGGRWTTTRLQAKFMWVGGGFLYAKRAGWYDVTRKVLFCSFTGEF